MALIKCRECGNEISDSVKTCPKCGIEIQVSSTTISSKKRKLNVLALIFLIFYSLMTIYIVVDNISYIHYNIWNYGSFVLYYILTTFSLWGLLFYKVYNSRYLKITSGILLLVSMAITIVCFGYDFLDYIPSNLETLLEIIFHDILSFIDQYALLGFIYFLTIKDK